MADDRPPPSDSPGDASRLVDETYAELRRIAERYVRRERAASVQATELVHEAYIRLQKGDQTAWRNRTHFLALAAIAMRRLLVERGRARAAAKRGGPQARITLDDALLADEGAGVDVLDLDEALARLAHLDPRQARVVELRYFGGMTVDEAGAALGISPATVKRDWTLARAWLLRELDGSRPR